MEVDGFPFEDSVPLGRGDSFREVVGDSKEGLNSQDVLTELEEDSAGFHAAAPSGAAERGIIPRHVFFLGSLPEAS